MLAEKLRYPLSLASNAFAVLAGLIDVEIFKRFPGAS